MDSDRPSDNFFSMRNAEMSFAAINYLNAIKSNPNRVVFAYNKQLLDSSAKSIWSLEDHLGFNPIERYDQALYQLVDFEDYVRFLVECEENGFQSMVETMIEFIESNQVGMTFDDMCDSIESSIVDKIPLSWAASIHSRKPVEIAVRKTSHDSSTLKESLVRSRLSDLFP